MPETIWSTGSATGGSPIQANTPLQYKTVLDQVDPDVARYFNSNNPGERRFSFNDGSDIDAPFFGLKKGSLSAITAPVGNSNNNNQPGSGNRLNFGTASISGGIASRHPPQDSFLQKFSSVADATREIELTNGLSKLGLENPSLRRTSFNSEPKLKPFVNSPHGGSLNENLNTSRHQSISEKIDHYNSTSPIQASAALSINSDINEQTQPPVHSQPQNPNVPHNFWNPATATSFTPALYNYPGNAPQDFNPYLRGNMPQYGHPFMVPSPQPPQFIDPGLYNMTYQEKGDDEQTSEDSADPKDEDKQNRGQAPGIGLMSNRQMPPPVSAFMFHPFNPYQMYPQYPPPSNMMSPIDHEAVVHTALPPSPPPPPPAPVPTVLAPTSSGKRKKNANGNSNSGTTTKGGNHIYRSPLLEEVRSNSKSKEYYLKDIYGHAVEFTKDQYGSRFIQQKLADASDEEKEAIFNEIRDISYELMTDVFGNYVIQKYFEHGSYTQKQVLLESMIGHIYELSLQMYGCRVIQRALEEIDTESQIRIVEELKDHVLFCSKDQNGNHVIQKSIERIPFERIRFILDSLNNQIYHLSTHPYGCRVIQRLLEFSELADQQFILDELNRFIFYLIQDQYGNYVMQHILERGDAKDREEILKIVLGSVVSFSKHKFASNVIEKCIKYGTLEQRRRILHEVMLGNEDFEIDVVGDDSPLALMMKDQFANYVIQKLVEGFDSKSEEKRILIVKLRQYLKQISSKNSYGKHLASVEKMIIVAETAIIEAESR